MTMSTMMMSMALSRRCFLLRTTMSSRIMFPPIATPAAATTTTTTTGADNSYLLGSIIRAAAYCCCYSSSRLVPDNDDVSTRTTTTTKKKFLSSSPSPAFLSSISHQQHAPQQRRYISSSSSSSSSRIVVALPLVGGGSKQKTTLGQRTTVLDRNCWQYQQQQKRYFTIETEMEFHPIADMTLDKIQDAIDELLDPLSDIDYETNLSSGVLTISLPPHGTWVINKQTPNRQIWWSSPLSGPKRFEYDEKDKLWFATKDGINLGFALSEELQHIYGNNNVPTLDLKV